MGLPNCSRCGRVRGGQLHRRVTRPRHAQAQRRLGVLEQPAQRIDAVRTGHEDVARAHDDAGQFELGLDLAAGGLLGAARHARRGGVDDEQPDAVVGAGRDDDGARRPCRRARTTWCRRSATRHPGGSRWCAGRKGSPPCSTSAALSTRSPATMGATQRRLLLVACRTRRSGRRRARRWRRRGRRRRPARPPRRRRPRPRNRARTRPRTRGARCRATRPRPARPTAWRRNARRCLRPLAGVRAWRDRRRCGTPAPGRPPAPR